MIDKKPWQIIANEIDLPPGTASWVLMAHLFTLLSPLTVIWATWAYWDYLQTVMYAPGLLYLSAVLMMIASSFEIAQNTFDRWYLTEQPPALCDWLFSSLIMLSVAVNVMAFVGDQLWFSSLAFVLALLFSAMYLLGGPMNIPRSILGVGSSLAMFYVLRDPVVFLPFLSIYLTVVFLEVLLKTHAQSMHGFLTGIHGLALLCTPIAIMNAAAQTAVSWHLVLLVAIAVVLPTQLIKPWLGNLKATPRQFIEPNKQ